MLPIGSLELVIALSDRHRLAAIERISRPELLAEPFLTWPRTFNPPLMDHIHRSLFGDLPHPVLIEVSEMNQAARLTRLAHSDHMVGLGFPGRRSWRSPVSRTGGSRIPCPSSITDSPG